MPATNTESFTGPRDSLPNSYAPAIEAREVDFVSRFSKNWKALTDLMGIVRPIRKAPGTQLVPQVLATVALEDGEVDPGAVIPYSKATFTKGDPKTLTIKKYAKAVPIEDVDKYGAAIAVEKSDDAFLTQLQSVVMTDFYTTLTTRAAADATATTWQQALAKAQGLVLDKFARMQLEATEVVGFANILDAYDYLGNAEISMQNQFGLTYMQNFLGYKTLFLLPANFIPAKTVIAVPVENLDLYYSDPADSDFAKLGLQYTSDGETNLIGFHAQGNYSTAVGESYAIMGMTLFAEYEDGVVKTTFTPAA